MTFHPELLAGKTALVTGGTTGIGAGIASALARLGAQVVAAGVQSDSHQLAADPAVAIRELDVRDNAAIESLMATLPQLDLLVNCAGIISRGKEHQVEVFENVIDINLTGTLRCCAAARKKLAQRQDRKSVV